MIENGTVLFAAAGLPEEMAIEMAKGYITAMNYTWDDVKIVRVDGAVWVKAKRDLP